MTALTGTRTFLPSEVSCFAACTHKSSSVPVPISISSGLPSHSSSMYPPKATLSIDRSQTDDLSSTYNEKDQETLKATVTWPFFSGGKNYANLNKSKSLELQKNLLLSNMTTKNQTDVASAWSNYESNKSLLNSVKAQVNAAEIANEGIVAEYNSGSDRTTLEVIQSNSFLLNAQISLVDSERNYILSQYNLLKSVGLLTSDYLKIK